ncbi:hypothetical protein [Paenibacillus jiagnxiensis]|uniref:hypothetical protein n=1 Tax=Paenibacillus jiagnxiensis TaxID=3228926 RepID=UPI0038D48F7C
MTDALPGCLNMSLNMQLEYVCHKRRFQNHFGDMWSRRILVKMLESMNLKTQAS